MVSLVFSSMTLAASSIADTHPSAVTSTVEVSLFVACSSSCRHSVHTCRASRIVPSVDRDTVDTSVSVIETLNCSSAEVVMTSSRPAQVKQRRGAGRTLFITRREMRGQYSQLNCVPTELRFSLAVILRVRSELTRKTRYLSRTRGRRLGWVGNGSRHLPGSL